jgi:hypothetical protein
VRSQDIKIVFITQPIIGTEILRLFLENKFAQVVTTAIFHYIEIFMKDFRKYLSEANISYVMTNNIQQIREQLQDLYITMGQDQLHQKAQEYFREAQSKLSKTIGKITRQY